MRRRFAGAASLLLALAVAGCSTAKDAAASRGYAHTEAAGGESPMEGAPALPPVTAQVDEESTTYDFDDDLVASDLVRPDGESLSARRASAPTAARSWFGREPEPVAAVTPGESAPDRAPTLPESDTKAVSDQGPSGPLLVYTASFLLSVYEVEKAQLALKETTKKLGGFVSAHTDTQITLRVPAAHFEEALAAVESAGKVRARNVQALEVGEQVRDLNIRLRTAEAVRARLEAMLARAEKVEDALRVEKEIERVVREIEQLKGQLRGLGDRIAFSTLSVEFRPEARPDIDDSDVVRLPYPWLDELGLHHLLELAP